MTAEFILYVATGKLILYILNKFVKDNVKNEFLLRLVSCELCSGVWIYSLFAIIYKINILSDIFPYVPVVTGVITGCATSFIVHLMTLGWHEKFDVVVI